MQTDPALNTLRELLGDVRDLEKMGRQILMGRILPSAISQLHRSMGIWEQCLEAGGACLGLGPAEIAAHRKETRRLMEYIATRLDDEAHFRPGVCPKLDKMQVELRDHLDLIEGFRTCLNTLLGSADAPTDHVKVHETAKSGRSLVITQTRALALRDLLRKGGAVEVGNVRIPYTDIRVVSSNRTEKTDTVDCPAVDRASRQILALEEKIAERTETLFAEFLQGLEREFYSSIIERSRAIALLDVLTTKAALSLQFNYCRPEVAGGGAAPAEGWADARDLRHVLIEHIQTNEVYVANDLAIGVPGQKGILLYGTNAVGKTSLIKALGIAVVMAQAGWFVPAGSFRFSPYRAIYSRILGNDDIFRGLSTFVVEMSELRVILRMADAGSLVLGDEVCSGTETESALSIFTAALHHLYERRTSFIFATHFHEIVKYDEVRAMEDEVRAMHMCVSYDAELGALVYDRKLRMGSGDAIYGLEVAKSLFMPEDFLERAFAIRAKYFAGADKSPLAFQTTPYHSKKVRDICEICREEVGTEIHHLAPQKDADDRGFIGTFHKNHPANLASICEKCHVKMHGVAATPVQRRKTTRGTVLVPSKNNPA